MFTILSALLLSSPALGAECSASNPCGDWAPCSSDNQCQSGICAMNSRLAGVCQPVPELGDEDYCYLLGDCGISEGDCDNDSQCQSNLVCQDNTGHRYGYPYQSDTCELPLGHYDRCTPETPCIGGEGDCDTNADCMSDHLCVDNVGSAYGYAWWVDVCTWIGG